LAGFVGQKHEQARSNSFIDVINQNRRKVCIRKAECAFNPSLKISWTNCSLQYKKLT